MSLTRSDVWSALARQLADVRRVRGLGVVEVAARVGVPTSRLEEWEAGVGSPSVSEFVDWTLVVGCELVVRPSLRRGRGSAAMGAWEQIVKVLSAELPSYGGWCPSEQKLAERFGVSRGMVRRALEVLQGRRLVEPVWGRGWRVLHPDAATV